VEGLKNTRQAEGNKLVNMPLVCKQSCHTVFHRPLCNDFAATNNGHGEKNRDSGQGRKRECDHLSTFLSKEQQLVEQ